MSSGVYVSVEGLHGVANQLEAAADALHGHADTLEGIVIPPTAFGASTAAAAQWAAGHPTLTGTVRAVATRTASHGSGARSAIGRYTSDDSGASGNIEMLSA